MDEQSGNKMTIDEHNQCLLNMCHVSSARALTVKQIKSKCTKGFVKM